jgi:DNA-binding transcriptional MerR regulator
VESGDADGSDEASAVASPTGPIPDKLYFRIGEVAQLVGVDAHVLRYWESEFRLKPHRSASGQRLYRKQDLSRFLRIKHLLHEEGYTIAGARKVLSGQAGGPATSVDPERIRTALNRVESLRDRIREIRDDILAAE